MGYLDKVYLKNKSVFMKVGRYGRELPWIAAIWIHRLRAVVAGREKKEEALCMLPPSLY
jgi:hypothetical protein